MSSVAVEVAAGRKQMAVVAEVVHAPAGPLAPHGLPLRSEEKGVLRLGIARPGELGGNDGSDPNGRGEVVAAIAQLHVITEERDVIAHQGLQRFRLGTNLK